MWWGNPIIAQRLIHILVNHIVLRIPYRVLSREEKIDELKSKNYFGYERFQWFTKALLLELLGTAPQYLGLDQLRVSIDARTRCKLPSDDRDHPKKITLENKWNTFERRRSMNLRSVPIPEIAVTEQNPLFFHRPRKRRSYSKRAERKAGFGIMRWLKISEWFTWWT